MGMPAGEVKALLRTKGWTMTDVAARWGVSVFWMSKLVNQVHTRPPCYEDAFRGLPQRDEVAVQREARHNRKKKALPRAWTPAEMFPKGRLFQALDNKVVDEDTELAVVAVCGEGGAIRVRFVVTQGDSAGEEVEIPMDVAQCHLGDLARDLP